MNQNSPAPQDVNPLPETAQVEPSPAERRLILRLYDYWAELRGERVFPALRDMQPERLAGFKAQSFLLDFVGGVDRPRLRFVGADLIADCGRDVTLSYLDQVPPRSLLNRLTDHYLEVIATRAPVGFEAEFTHANGQDILYRGLMAPFSDNGEDINFVLGAISGKVRPLVPAEPDPIAPAEPDPVGLAEPGEGARAPDEPGEIAADPAPLSEDDDPAAPEPEPEPEPEPVGALADLLEDCRHLAQRVTGDEQRHRAALYQALGKCYALHGAAERDAAAYRDLLRQAGLKIQARAPFTPLVKLVFGARFDKTRIAEYALALAHARRNQVGAARVASFIEQQPGGIKGCVRAERRLRRQESNRPPSAGLEQAAQRLRALPAQASLSPDQVPGLTPGVEFLLLLGRQGDGGAIEILQGVDLAPSQLEPLLRKIAATGK